ncbi:MAG: electron transfer flavoprotein subunit alpha/FixB family protein [Acidaminococcaceae bacterium]|nr:electron transfer flavoprotein subunit alpha/FixB family protein [Acidaminococcaceae bacterium]
MAKTENSIWVVAQLESGEALGVTYELLGQARRLADQAGQNTAVVLIGKENNGQAEKLIAQGADVVYSVLGAEYEDYNVELYTNAICELAQAYQPNGIMFGATIDGRDLAPRVAARLKTGLCADCTEVEMGENGLLKWTRPALGGNLMGTIVCSDLRPQMGSVRPKIFAPMELDAGRQGEVINYTVKNKVESKVEILKKEPLSTGGKLKIEDAEVVCAGGRGFGDAERFAILEELAGLFEKSAVAGSRAAVDEKWVDHASQVGQSGKTVAPKLYVACGISGALQHICGMKESEVIVAINKDENAPIFEVAHYGLVGDVHVVIPKLIEKIKAYKES